MADTPSKTTENHSTESVLGDAKDFAASLWHSGVENTVNGVGQLVSDITEPTLGIKLPELNVFEPSQPTSDTQKFLDQAGSVVGMIVPFMIAKFGVGKVAGRLGIEASSSTMYAAGEQGATGAVMGLLLTPTEKGQNAFLGRLQNGFVDAGTFAAMGAAGAKLTTKFGAAGDLPLASRVARSSLIGIGSGVPGGFANAELSSFSNGDGPASLTGLRNDIGGFALFGGLMGGIEAARAPHEQVASQENAPPSDIAQRFPQYSADQLLAGRTAVLNELSQVKASSPDGQPLSVADKLAESPLNDVQKERVLSSLAAVRENYMSFRNDQGNLDPTQEKNWIHTQGEFGRVLDSAKAMKLTPEQTEDALLGSMFSDAVKTNSNFMVHHLDGAKAAESFLTNLQDDQFNTDRIHGIVQAIKEHQIGPPGFMAMIYSGAIRAKLNMERGQEVESISRIPEAERSPEQQARLKELNAHNDAFWLNNKMITAAEGSDYPNAEAVKATMLLRQANGPFVSDDEAQAINGLTLKISNPFRASLIDTAAGGKALELTDLERQLLSTTGNTEWYVPHESTPWYGASRALINGDSIDNYATPGGFSKLVGEFE